MRKKLAAFIKQYHLWWYAITVVFYAAAIPLTIWVFPATTLLLTIAVLFGGFTAAIASFASAILAVEQDEAIEDIADDG